MVQQVKINNMKNFIFWLAKIFNVDLTVEKIIYKDRIVEVEKQVTLDGVVEGDVTVKGNLIVKGYLYVDGEVSCYKIKEEEV